MNMFQFAVASIVDANTGNGLVHGGAKIDYAAAERHGRRIRSKSFLDLLAAIGSGLGGLISNYRARAKQRRELNVLLKLNDHVLDDIGFTRGDLYAAQVGAIDLVELDNRRHNEQRYDLPRMTSPGSIETLEPALDAINEQVFEQARCA